MYKRVKVTNRIEGLLKARFRCRACVCGASIYIGKPMKHPSKVSCKTTFPSGFRPLPFLPLVQSRPPSTSSYYIIPVTPPPSRHPLWGGSLPKSIYTLGESNEGSGCFGLACRLKKKKKNVICGAVQWCKDRNHRIDPLDRAGCRWSNDAI